MQSTKILLFDPGKEFSEYLFHLLPLVGSFEAEVCHSPLEVLAKATVHQPPLIIFGDELSKDTPLVLEELFKKIPGLRMILISETGKKAYSEFTSLEVLTRPYLVTNLGDQVCRLLGVKSSPPAKQEYARLLVADDEEEIPEILSDVFKPLGVEVYSASDGREALEIFHKKSCNLAIIDFHMPEINGLELIRILEDEKKLPKIIILLTAALGSRIQEIKRFGFPVMPKPIDLAILERQILDTCQKFNLALHQKIEG